MRSQIEIDERHEFFRAAAESFIAEVNAVSAPDKLILRTEAIEFAVKLYFLLTDSYKQKRVHKPDEHRTEPYKIAALTTAALTGVCILEPADKDNVTAGIVALCNEVFSVYCACLILKVVKWEVPDMILQRHYLALENLELSACSEFLKIAERDPPKALALSTLDVRHTDLFALDMLVNIYLEWWRTY